MGLIYGKHSAGIFILQRRDEKVHKHRYPISPCSYLPLHIWRWLESHLNASISLSTFCASPCTRIWAWNFLKASSNSIPEKSISSTTQLSKRRNRQKMKEGERVCKKNKVLSRPIRWKLTWPALRSKDIWGLAQTFVEQFGDILWYFIFNCCIATVILLNSWGK